MDIPFIKHSNGLHGVICELYVNLTWLHDKAELSFWPTLHNTVVLSDTCLWKWTPHRRHVSHFDVKLTWAALPCC